VLDAVRGAGTAVTTAGRLGRARGTQGVLGSGRGCRRCASVQKRGGGGWAGSGCREETEDGPEGEIGPGLGFGSDFRKAFLLFIYLKTVLKLDQQKFSFEIRGGEIEIKANTKHCQHFILQNKNSLF
jgi:hypothetical protein